MFAKECSPDGDSLERLREPVKVRAIPNDRVHLSAFLDCAHMSTFVGSCSLEHFLESPHLSTFFGSSSLEYFRACKSGQKWVQK